MVTDEIENEKSEGEFFAQLFYKYYTEVFPAKLVFVSFLEDPSKKGRMVQSLENMGLVPLQFRLDSIRPDLTKVDSLLGVLSSECSFFNVQAKHLAKVIVKEKDNFENVIMALKNLPLPENYKSRKSSNQEEYSDDEKEEKEEKKSAKQKEEEIPDEFLCPITNDVMEDPVVASDGYTYEKAAIEEWLQKK